MRSIFAIAILYCMLNSSIVSGVATAAPIPKSLKSQKPKSLVGSVWSGTTPNSTAVSEYRFLDDGQLLYRHTADAKKATPGLWNQHGNEVTFEINKYSEHAGTLDGDTISLQSKNKTNLTWVTTLRRQADGN